MQKLIKLWSVFILSNFERRQLLYNTPAFAYIIKCVGIARPLWLAQKNTLLIGLTGIQAAFMNFFMADVKEICYGWITPDVRNFHHAHFATVERTSLKKKATLCFFHNLLGDSSTEYVFLFLVFKHLDLTSTM